MCVGEAFEGEIEAVVAVVIYIGYEQAVQKHCKSSTKCKNCRMFSSLPWFVLETVAISGGGFIGANFC